MVRSLGEFKINIVGAGLSGLSAAITIAREGRSVRLFSLQDSERAQSVMAEGGINAALDNMGEEDRPEYHFADTVKSGAGLLSEEAVRGLTEAAPEIVRKLAGLGVPFNRDFSTGKLLQRSFGGQKKKRTVYSKSSTGKAVMTALIDEARKYEADGLIERFPHHEMLDLFIDGGICYGLLVRDTYTKELLAVSGPVLLATGGLNGLFPGKTTGTTANSGNAAAISYSKGVVFSNLEMIQFHPTTIEIPGKRCLISEAARGEGGRLFTIKNGKPFYFMEEKYPELKNLMPRDVVSREEYACINDAETDGKIYLDMTGIPKEIWDKKLSDLRNEIQHYLNKDPMKEFIPVSPGIHYFMGGVDTDVNHATNIRNLYASGECCSMYHGANRLGGNSMLGAIYGGKVAARGLMAAKSFEARNFAGLEESKEYDKRDTSGSYENRAEHCKEAYSESYPEYDRALSYKAGEILFKAMGIVRNEEGLNEGLKELSKLSEGCSGIDKKRIELAKAIVSSALERKESRGAHFRSDYPEKSDKFGYVIKKKYGCS